MIDHDITANIKQISKKLTDLKNYYGGQRRRIESSKSSGAGTDELFVSPWKFYESLEFLSDAFTPRKTKNNTNEEDDGASIDVTPPSAKSTKKDPKVPTSELHGVTYTTTFQSVISKKNEEAPPEDVDDMFGKLLIGQLKLIPECDLKDDLKISLQQMILRCKRQVNPSIVR